MCKYNIIIVKIKQNDKSLLLKICLIEALIVSLRKIVSNGIKRRKK